MLQTYSHYTIYYRHFWPESDNSILKYWLTISEYYHRLGVISPATAKYSTGVLLPKVSLHKISPYKLVGVAGFEPAMFTAWVRDFKSRAFRQFRHTPILNQIVLLVSELNCHLLQTFFLWRKKNYVLLVLLIRLSKHEIFFHLICLEYAIKGF